VVVGSRAEAVACARGVVTRKCVVSKVPSVRRGVCVSACVGRLATPAKATRKDGALCRRQSACSAGRGCVTIGGFVLTKWKVKVDELSQKTADETANGMALKEGEKEEGRHSEWHKENVHSGGASKPE